jgi:hypothetical protein
MNSQEVADYLRSTRNVEGWFFPIDAYLFGLIDSIQKNEGISGNLFEIGVHHGKTAVFLGRAADAGELLGVCDVFGQQQLNADRSGEGSLELFTNNMRSLGGTSEGRLRVFARRSDTLTTGDTTTECRFFHIDGGHLPADVRADLVTALAALRPEGVVAVDDLFNPNWPGVSEGFYQFMRERPGELVPILIGGNKVMLTGPSAAETYERHWRDPRFWADAIDSPAYRFEAKEWLGRQVMTAIRLEWVDLDPIAAATAHLGEASWKSRLLRRVLS